MTHNEQIEYLDLKVKFARIKKELASDVRECHSAQKRAAKLGEYTAAIELKGMIDAFKKVQWRLTH